MGMIDIKEKVIKTLENFFDRNKEYTIEAYISHPATNSIFGEMYVTTDRTFKTDDKKITLEWGNKYDVANNISIAYDDVLACYGEEDEYGQQMVFVILKCGISIDFECCGLRLG